MSDSYCWYPTEDYLESANVLRVMHFYGVTTMNELRRKSVEDVSRYWDFVVNDLGIPFTTQYTKVLDVSKGIQYPDWFVGGTLNLADSVVGRWARDPASADRVAVLHEDEAGRTRSLTYVELEHQIESVASGMRSYGIGKGDVVAMFLPMIPEAVVSFYAIARIGAIVAPLFSGFAPSALVARIQDANAKAVIVADGTVRRSRSLGLKPLLDQALPSCPSIEQVFVVSNLESTQTAGSNEVPWERLLASPTEGGQAEQMRATDPLLLAYTSGTTGRPKGAVHTHAGFLVKTASEAAYSFDISTGSVFCWITDMGWIMGPLSIVGTHANGATLLLYEGAVDVPDLTRIWKLTERHRVSMLGVSPTLVRTLRTRDPIDFTVFDLSSVYTLGSTGEPWDPASYDWLAKVIFGTRVPVINFSGGTEVGGSFLAPYPIEPIRSCSLGGPSLGMDVDVVDSKGQPLRGSIGEMICRQPWPAMTKGVWQDNDRYLEAYWSTFPGLWRHGDFALVDEDGQWFILGRSDDVMNVAGKRLAPAEVEAVMASHPAVSEAAVVGIPDSKKGEAVWAFWVPRPGVLEDISEELKLLVASELGKPFTPTAVRRVSQLPKTRSAKIMRRAVRSAVLGEDPGDLSGAENPDAIAEIRASLQGEI